MRNKTVGLYLLLMGCPAVCAAQKNNLDSVLAKIIGSPAAAPGRKTSPDPRAYLVKIKPGVRKEAFAHQGVAILRTLGQRLVIIEAPREALREAPRQELPAAYEEKWPVNHRWKLSNDLLLHGDPASRNHYTVRVSDPSVMRAIASVPHVRLVRSKNNVATLFTSLERILAGVIPLDGVLYVGVESAQPHTESPVSDLNLHPNAVNRIHHLFPRLNGEGITISIREQSYDTEDIDFGGRHLPSSLRASETSNHATEMATIAAGAGNSFITGKGVAWGAQVTSSGFDDLFPDADQAYARLNAWVQNHSYGTAIENFYGARAEAFDGSANRNPTLLHVFSSGNEGSAASATGPYQGVPGFANLTGNFKMAKNILTVGSVDAVGRPVAFSSRGPAFDGRIKPEVVAYSSVGSSNSAALVSGMVALLQQAHQRQEGTLPASALVKSLLINSAEDAGSAGIDHTTGFGNVDGHRTLRNLTEKRYFSGSVRQGEVKDFVLPVPANAGKLKVTVVWNDPAALPNANLALVNDLDLRLRNATGSTWLPWILDASADPAKLRKAATRGEDHLNNVEQITVDEPAPGAYVVSVQGFEVAGSQPFYVAYQWDTRHQFEWSSPTGSDNMPHNGEADTYFFWKSTLVDSLGRLEYTPDAGLTWHRIADSVDLRGGFYRWPVPEITAWAQARMVVGSAFYPTDYFTISRPLPITVGFNCADSVLIQWPPSAEITKYELSVFEDQSLKTVLVTTDTVLVLKKSALTSPFFAVQPVLKEGVRGIRARTFHYPSLSESCLLVAFYAEIVGEDGIDLIAQLGTTYGVDRILIERKKKDIFETIGSVRPVASQVQFLDAHPQQGVNVYRVRVLLLNGQEIISEAVEGYLLTKVPFIVFPNPVSRVEKLNVFSKEFTNQVPSFRLYGPDGKLRLTTQLLSSRASVSLAHFSPGLYQYSIQTSEGYFTGKVIVE